MIGGPEDKPFDEMSAQFWIEETRDSREGNEAQEGGMKPPGKAASPKSPGRITPNYYKVGEPSGF